MKYLITLILLSFGPLSLESQELRIIFMGDIMGHDSQIAAAKAAATYDYRPCFEHIRPYLQEADLVVGNLEVTFGGPPYKGYPAFSSPDELATALKWAGFDILVNANNHGLDKGSRGLLRTLDVLDTTRLVQTGTFRDSLDRERRYPLILEKKGIRLALLNFTYGTNGIRDRPPTIINRIDTLQIKADLDKARAAEPQFILACVHWGQEYKRVENSKQQELAAFLFKHGVDAVIGSHPHVVQPIRGSGKGDLVAYSLGNLVSNQRDRYRDGGIAFELTLARELEITKVGPGELVSRDSTYITDHAYLPLWVWKPRTASGRGFALVPANMDQDSELYGRMTAEDRKKMKLFYDDTRTHLKGVEEMKIRWN